MFQEFNDAELRWWNNLSSEDKKNKINREVALAVDIEIIKTDGGKILSEHKFYQQWCFHPVGLIYGILLKKVSEDNVEFIIEKQLNAWQNGYTDEGHISIISVKPNEERTFDIGSIPFTKHYIVRVSNLTYGGIPAI